MSATNAVTFANESLEAVVLPDLACRIHRLRAFGHDVLRSPPTADVYGPEPFFWGSFVMAPWCNRVEAGPQVVGDAPVDLQPNFPDGHALHGQVYRLAWTQVSADTFQVRAGGDEWPWRYQVSQRIVLTGATFGIDVRLVNLSPAPMPAGLGAHPWFSGPVEVAIHADRVHESNLDSSPQPVPVGGRFDLRQLGAAAPDLDGAWTMLSEPPVELSWPKTGIAAVMRITPPAPYIVAASPSQLGGVAVEPQTHAPQGLRRLRNGEPGGLRWLAPEGVLELRVEVEFSRRSPMLG